MQRIKKFLPLILVLFFFFKPVYCISLSDSTKYNSTKNSEAQVDTLAKVDSIKTKLYRNLFLQYKSGIQNLEGTTKIKKHLNLLDYRFTGDFIPYMSFGYEQDLGWTGQPSEIMLYGLGFGSISYLSSQVPINNRITNALDLNITQSESIDSIIIPPIYKGFLYNLYNNPISTIFIEKNEYVKTPYTRIRYYQGPNSEGYVDAIYRTRLMHKLFGQFEATNTSIENSFTNSSYSSWKLHTSIRYLFNKSFNLVGDYSFVNQKVGLYGGVDKDSILSLDNGSVNDLMYNRILAPVNFKDRYQKTKRHNFTLKLLSSIGKTYNSELNFYYQFQLVEFRQNEKNSDANIKRIFDNNKYKTLGINFSQNLKLNRFNFDIISKYESTEFKTPLFSSNKNITSFSIAGNISPSLLGSKVKPDLFGKYLNTDGNTFLGIGGSVFIILSDNISIYSGYSRIEKPFSVLQNNFFSTGDLTSNDIQNINLSEFGIKFSYDKLNGVLKYFSYNNNNEFVPVLNKRREKPKSIYVTNYFTAPNTIHGVNLSLNIKIWKILIETNTNLYPDNNRLTGKSVPTFAFRGGIYFKGFLFHNNLDLKTGFNFQFATEQDFRFYDFERNMSSNYFDEELILLNINRPQVPQYFTMDFFTAGRIQERAIVYFILENLFDTKYYIMPYYPKQERGFRFGISWEFLN